MVNKKKATVRKTSDSSESNCYVTKNNIKQLSPFPIKLNESRCSNALKIDDLLRDTNKEKKHL